tara:strand:- start:20 stop:373 length:354 start_codon:yes stop_codon:yes gene_type:complete
MSKFRQKFSFNKRLDESIRMHQKYPDRVCVIVEKSKNSINIPDIDRTKFLIPKDLTVGNFMYVIRKRIHLSPEKSIYLFINNLVMPTISTTFAELYDSHKHKDGFLYIYYAGESTFG